MTLSPGRAVTTAKTPTSRRNNQEDTVTFTERTRLMAFGLFGWTAAMVAAANTPSDLLRVLSPVQAGIMAGCFAVALLPGRTARFL